MSVKHLTIEYFDEYYEDIVGAFLRKMPFLHAFAPQNNPHAPVGSAGYGRAIGLI